MRCPEQLRRSDSFQFLQENHLESIHSHNKAHNHRIKLRFSTISTSNVNILLSPNDRFESVLYDGAKRFENCVVY